MDSIKIDRTSFLVKLLAAALLCLTESTFASDASSPLGEPTVDAKNSYRISARHIEGGGVGYNEGYTTLAVFFASDPEEEKLLPFLDFRGHVFDDGYFAGNAGIGLRRAMGHRIYGINSYYDARNTQSLFYNQLGLGLESLGTSWDFRANGYLPVGKQTTPDGNGQFSGFSGHEMLVSQPYQSAMKGGDAELGFPLPLSKGVSLYAAAGPYYYIGELGLNALGGKVRLKGGLGRNISLEVSNAYDSVFHNSFQVQLGLTLPLERKSLESAITSRNQAYGDVALARMVEPVDRDEIIVAENNNKVSPAIDPTTGLPYYFVFVDNTSHSAGTFESPYPTLALAQDNSSAGDIIYVFPGDGTTTGMNSGITLKADQKFWGSGTNQNIQTTIGNISIPAYTSTAPQITNNTLLGGNGITLATNNQISGFTIEDATDNGIYGLNPQDVQIYSTTIDNSVSDQIHLEYTEVGSVDLDNLTLSNGQKAISIESTGSSFVGTVNHSTMQGNTVSFIDVAFTGETTFNFTNNTVDNNYASLFDFSDSSSLLISGNTITNSTSPSEQPLTIVTRAGVSSFSATVENNTISNNEVGAINFVLSNTNSANLAIINNTMNQNGVGTQAVLFGAAILIDTNGTSSSNLDLALTDNILSSNTGHVLAVTDGGFNEITVTATDNFIDSNDGGGFVFDNTATTLTLTATGNTISNGGDHAIITQGGRTMTAVNMILSSNQITENRNQGDPTVGVNGVSLHHVGNTVNFTAENNNISGNSGTGIIFYSSSVMDTVNAIIDNNTISNNQNVASDPGGGGIDLEQFNNLSATVTNNTLANNASYGVYISSAIPASSACLSLSGNDSNLGYYLANDGGSGSTFNLAPLNVNTVNIGTITTSGTITPISACPP